MTYRAKRVLVGSGLFVGLFLTPPLLVMAPIIYDVVAGHATGVGFVDGSLVGFLVSGIPWALVCAALAYWLSGVFVKRPAER